MKKVSDDCRNLKIDKKEFFGGSMTITSLGGIGGSFFTPIINFPEVAILGIGRSYKNQVFKEGKFIPRTILPWSLSYDHRIIDGAEAAKFNNELKDNLGANFAYNLSKWLQKLKYYQMIFMSILAEKTQKFFQIFGCETMQKMSKIGIKGLVKERLLQHL